MRRIVSRLLLLASLWWLLAGNDTYSWLLGGPVILALAAWRLESGVAEGRLQLWRLPLFVPMFLYRTVAGSCDVAWRALDRRLPIDPVVYDYALRLPAGSPARVFFANCLSLLPGTLTISWADDMLRVHVLTSGPQAMSELRSLESQIASLFGHTLVNVQEDTFA